MTISWKDPEVFMIVVFIIIVSIVFLASNALSLDQRYADDVCNVVVTPYQYIINTKDVDIVTMEGCTMHCFDKNLLKYIQKYHEQPIEIHLKKGLFGYYVVNASGYAPDIIIGSENCDICGKR
jgi:hypothetical protein